jgi:uncharacterized protein (DUF1697 family)
MIEADAAEPASRASPDSRRTPHRVKVILLVLNTEKGSQSKPPRKSYTAPVMPVLISMLRGVNVVGHNRIKMDALRVLYESLKFDNPRTFIQSGNVIFRTKLPHNPKNSAALAKKIQDGIERTFGFRPEVILRTPDELRAAIAATPFPAHRNLHPGKVLVTFLTAQPPSTAHTTLLTLKDYPEEVHLKGRELYIYFPNGAGQTKLPWSKVEKLLKVNGTARNWNSVTKMLAIAEEMEAEG